MLRALGVPLIDCQQQTEHLASFGARPMPRREFAGLLPNWYTRTRLRAVGRRPPASTCRVTRLNDLPLASLQFYATAPYPCSYLPDRVARSQVATPSHLIDGRVYSELVARVSAAAARSPTDPYCDHCHACVPVRVPVGTFKPNRTQRRCLRTTRTLASPPRLAFDAEHYALYLRYQRHRHPGGGMDQDSREQYQHFLLHSNVATDLIEFREGGVLRMVSLVDRLADGLSSVYTFFDPGCPGPATARSTSSGRSSAAARWGCRTFTSATGSPTAARWRTRQVSGRSRGWSRGTWLPLV